MNLRNRQNGVVLFIALIVLVALSLAGLATMRSVDTAALVASNIGFRQAAVHSADRGIQTAYDWVTAQVGGGVNMANDDNAPGTGNGYFATVATGEAPDWYLQAAAWANAKLVGTDASSNSVSYLIHRLCTPAGECGQSQSTAAISGEGVDQSAPNYLKSPPQIHYRVTVRTFGPRNTVAYVQSLMRAK
jgi:type IV pilus assembly protein PilX